ncbi:hypothetical protein H6G89_14735 [Oscillatoria sp. FACHB-1407]|uniref:hypothetical protein n=1 Tax=Oscillatoria sp. FACHB-1407 TaxID=2692847 RepID=UPI0016835BF8|nr:hypothetical protein [Oscillatoria sp. FACHB-1407]MBD2462302.1 hypothetical protein [Oscillatoria sp. FACHB-1407]
MSLEKLRFVKNIDDSGWAYKDWQKGSQQHLHWSKGGEANANKAQLGDLVLLVQKPNHIQEARATHLVEVTSSAAETIADDNWGIVRQVSVIWVADFTHEASIPRDRDLFGWKRQRPQGTNLVELEKVKDGTLFQFWHSPNIFQRHVAGMLRLIEE